MITAWLIEQWQPEGYARPAWWAGVGALTTDPNRAVRFARQADAERVIDGFTSVGCGRWFRAVEHAWEAEHRYGDDRTIHRTGHVDVETDARGAVVAVWFRCHPVPFAQAAAGVERAAEMRRMYAEHPSAPVKAIVFDEEP